MKQVKKFDLVEAIRGYFSITPYMPIMKWIESYINYSDDVSAERDRPAFEQYPYQVEPIRQWEDLSIRKHVTVVACEQMRLRPTCLCWAYCGEWCMIRAKAW